MIDLSDINQREAFVVGMSMHGIPVPVQTSGSASYCEWVELNEWHDSLNGFTCFRYEPAQKVWASLEVINV